MKNIFKYLLIVSLGVILFSSCEETDIKLSENVIGLQSQSGRIGEDATAPIAIYVYNASASASTVNFSFSTEGIANPAVEGTDFTLVNSSKTLTFSGAYATDSILIKPIDNSSFEGNKQVIVKLSDPGTGFVLANEDTYTLSIIDDEHPLATWIGTYTVDAASNLQPGTWDETWGVKIEPIDGVTDQLSITGIGLAPGGDFSVCIPVVATFDKDNMTISVDASSEIGDPYDWAPCGIYGFNGSALVTSGTIDGTISNDGTIVFPYMAIGYTGAPSAYLWDIFTPTFHKN